MGKAGILLLLSFLLLSQAPAFAQLCNGSLGDPVVNITFGSGNNPGNRLSAASTYYQYVSTDCPNDGQYTVRNSTANCFSNSWYTLGEDHTPNDVNGYFMLVNASYQPGDFYVDTAHYLCGGTTYEFAAWIMNIMKNSSCGGTGINPNITFRIETITGTLLATYNTGNIPQGSSPVWQQYGVFFQTPTSVTDVVIRITNNAPGGCGNDLALDDITFRPCGPQITTSGVGGNTTYDLCEGDPTPLLLQGTYSSGYNNPVLQWQVSTNGGTSWIDIPGANGTNYIRTYTPAPGTYLYRLSIAEAGNIGIPQCRIASNVTTIYINAKPAQRDTTIKACVGSPATFSASGTTSFQYAWQGPGGYTNSQQTISFPATVFANAGNYQVIVTSDKGCKDTAVTTLQVNPVPTGAVNPTEVSICEGTGINLQASGGTGYLWQPATGLSDNAIANPFASPTDTITYAVIVFNTFGCTDTVQTKVNVWKKPVANAGPDKKIREGQSVLLEGAAAGTNVSWYWTPPSYLSSSTDLQPSASPTQDITYTLHVVSNNGCGTNTDNVFVRVFKSVKIPNAFSPNGDGINDKWVIEALETYSQSVIEVYNRNGQLIFRNQGYTRSWDGNYNGKPVPVGTYYYVIDLKEENFPKLTGWLLIVR
ncbi:MAG: gliding motility-associated C-terminal domain-containing protein [Chitinophagaceae bacterium]